MQNNLIILNNNLDFKEKYLIKKSLNQDNKNNRFNFSWINIEQNLILYLEAQLFQVRHIRVIKKIEYI